MATIAKLTASGMGAAEIVKEYPDLEAGAIVVFTDEDSRIHPLPIRPSP